jgi:hypothetical protein
MTTYGKLIMKHKRTESTHTDAPLHHPPEGRCLVAHLDKKMKNSNYKNDVICPVCGHSRVSKIHRSQKDKCSKELQRRNG